MSPLTCGWIFHPLPSKPPPSLLRQLPVYLLFAWPSHDMAHGTWLRLPTAFCYAWLHIWLFLYRPYTSVIGPLNLITMDILGWLGSCWGDCPVRDRILSSIPGLYPPGASDTSPSHSNCGDQKCLQALRNFPGGGERLFKSPSVKNFCSIRTQKGKSILEPVIYLRSSWTYISWIYTEYLNLVKF